MNFKEEYMKAAENMTPDRQTVDRMKANVLEMAEKGNKQKAFPFKKVGIAGGAIAACAVITAAAVKVLPTMSSKDTTAGITSNSTVNYAADTENAAGKSNQTYQEAEAEGYAAPSALEEYGETESEASDFVVNEDIAEAIDSSTIEPEYNTDTTTADFISGDYYEPENSSEKDVDYPCTGLAPDAGAVSAESNEAVDSAAVEEDICADEGAPDEENNYADESPPPDEEVDDSAMTLSLNLSEDFISCRIIINDIEQYYILDSTENDTSADGLILLNNLKDGKDYYVDITDDELLYIYDFNYNFVGKYIKVSE